MNAKNLLFYSYLVIMAGVCINMGESKQQNTLPVIAYHQLREKEGCFHAHIYDDGRKIEVRNFSFTGYTSLGGILCESDDSVNSFDIEKIKELVITNRSYLSNRYKNLDLLKATVITNNNQTINDLLIPRKVQISGIEVNTQIQKAWELANVERIIIFGPCASATTKTAEPLNTTPEKTVVPMGLPRKKEKSTEIPTRHPEEPASKTMKSLEKKMVEQPTDATENTVPKKEHPGFLASIFGLFDAIKEVFKALFNAIFSFLKLH